MAWYHGWASAEEIKHTKISLLASQLWLRFVGLSPGPEVITYKTSFKLSLAEHEISTAHKC